MYYLGMSKKLSNYVKQSMYISYERELDIDNKLNNYLKITVILNMFGPQKTLKKTRIKLYNTLAPPALLYGTKTWTIKTRDARRITAAEMKYMRSADLDRLQNKYTTCKGVKNNTSFAQITGIQEKMDTTCK
jgi:endonuclease I